LLALTPNLGTTSPRTFSVDDNLVPWRGGVSTGAARQTNQKHNLVSPERECVLEGFCSSKVVQDNNRFVVGKAVKCEDWSIWPWMAGRHGSPWGGPSAHVAPWGFLGTLQRISFLTFFVVYCSVTGLSLAAVKCSRAMIWAVRAFSNPAGLGYIKGCFSTLVYFFWDNSVKVPAIFELKQDVQ
jgi:hypothetical protein